MSREIFKKEFLIKIRSRKEILFGSFSHTLTKEKKCQTWMEIAEFAKSVCLIPRDKEWTYARDVLWQNIKKATMAKRDNINKTGKGGMGKFTEVDELVLDILGKESPLICGLGVRESMASTECASSVSGVSNFLSPANIHHVKVDVNEDTDDCPEPVPHQSSQHEEKKRKRSTTPKRLKVDDDHRESEKDKLMNEFFRVKIFKTRLEILDLETKLGLPRSEYTKYLSRSTSNVLDNLPGTSTLIVTGE
ncbi:UNVERIFIED_CONTAM: hypothetical protein RMT77_006297 [Armadillidium vulgare]